MELTNEQQLDIKMQCLKLVLGLAGYAQQMGGATADDVIVAAEKYYNWITKGE